MLIQVFWENMQLEKKKKSFTYKICLAFFKGFWLPVDSRLTVMHEKCNMNGNSRYIFKEFRT